MEKEFVVKLVIYKDYTEMHGQQNIQFSYYTFWKYVITRINFDISRFH